MAEKTKDREIIVSRTIDAPRDEVFAAFTEREHVENWWAPSGTETHEWDMRPGGLWRYSQPGHEGEVYPFKLTIVEIDRPDRFVYDFESEGEYASDPVRTTVTFDEEEGGQTEVTLHLLFATPEAREQSVEYGGVEGAEQSLEELADYLERVEIGS